MYTPTVKENEEVANVRRMLRTEQHIYLNTEPTAVHQWQRSFNFIADFHHT